MLLYVIRHGDPVYDPDSLTPLGRRQAEALGRRLAVHGLDRVFVSPLNRARLTAQPTCELLGLEPQVEEWTSEELAFADFSVPDPAIPGGRRWCFALENRLMIDCDNLSPDREWYEAPVFAGSNARAGMERIQRASDGFLARLGYLRENGAYTVTRPSEERVAVFCHLGFGTAWMSRLTGIAPQVFWANFDINHSGVSIFAFCNQSSGKTWPRCIAFSDTSHLYGDRLPLRFCNQTEL